MKDIIIPILYENLGTAYHDSVISIMNENGYDLVNNDYTLADLNGSKIELVFRRNLDGLFTQVSYYDKLLKKMDSYYG